MQRSNCTFKLWRLKEYIDKYSHYFNSLYLWIIGDEMILFLDTETTGFPQKNLLEQDPMQAKIVQIAALLTDNKGNIKASLNFLINHADLQIPDRLVELHGVSAERCALEGIAPDSFLKLMQSFLDCSTLVVAHNIEFDEKMLNIHGLFIKSTKVCTMELSRPICRLSFKDGKSGFKNPKLSEAYQYFSGKVLENAHDALADVMACKEIYFKLMGNKNV